MANSITFYGAAGEVTGSNFLLEIEGYKILVDCGLFQGGSFAEEKNNKPFVYSPNEIDAVIISHAHLDHVGRLPVLCRQGYTGPIYSIDATRDLAELTLLDSANLIAEEAKREKRPPLFDQADVALALSQFKFLKYFETQEILPGIKVTLREAGHILGSATIDISWSGGKKNIVFTGDLGNPPVPILRPFSYIDKADYVVVDSTYGGRIHEDFRTRKVAVLWAIDQIIKSKGTLLLPAFALERTQEILYELNDFMETRKLPKIPIYLDSPLAEKATEVFKKYSDYYNIEARFMISRGEFLFDFPGFIKSVTVDESKAINDVPAPKVIIAGSGMMNGGRILHHLLRYLPDPNSMLFIIGYQAQGTLGRQLYENAKRVKILGEDVIVHASVKALGAFSAHADQRMMIGWLANIQNPKAVFCAHGEIEQAIPLVQAIKNRLASQAIVPEEGMTYQLK